MLPFSNCVSGAHWICPPISGTPTPHPSDVIVTGINIPVRIGGVTVLPGDLAVGDREGLYFIPPHMVMAIHDEWTRKNFDEGKLRSSEICSTPADPALEREFDEYLKTWQASS